MRLSIVGFIVLVSILHLMGTRLVCAQNVPPEIESVQLAEQIYRLTISFNGVQSGIHMVASAGPDGVFLVDNHFSPLIFSQLIEDEVRTLSGGGDVEYGFNTHYHLDHNGGNGYFIDQGSEVIAHENVRTLLASGTTAMGLVEPGELFVTEPRPEDELPTQTFEADFELVFNGETVEISYHPRSHTNGDGVVYFSSAKVLALGDLVWPYEFPYVDILNEGSAVGLMETIGHLIERMPEDVQIVTGHGPVMTLNDLRAYHLMMTETIASVRERWASGESLEEIQAVGLDAAWEEWASALVPEATWIEYIFQSLEVAPTGTGLVPDRRGELLLPVTPNPSGGTTTVRYRLNAPADVELAVYSLRGQRVAVLEAGQRGAGEHVVTWTGTDTAGRSLAVGTYLCTLRTDDGDVATRLMTLVR